MAEAKKENNKSENIEEEKQKRDVNEAINKLKQEAEKKKSEKRVGEEQIKQKAEEKKHDEKDKKIAELTDMLQRMQAEMQNFKKQCDKSNEDFKKYCHADIVAKLLPILDSFELALKHTENKEEFVKGVELIYSQIYDMLEKEGLRPIKAEGEKFDPYKHEVLLTEKTEKDSEDEKIIQELQKGFMFKDKVLRYSKVKILKK